MDIDVVDVKFVSSIGEEVGLFKPPFHLFQLEGIGGLQAEHQTSVVSRLSGERYFGSRVMSRDILIGIDIKTGKSTPSMTKLRQRISRVCNPLLGLGTLYVTVKDGDSNIQYHIECVADGFPEFLESKNTGKKQKTLIKLKAPNSMWKTEQIIEEPVYESLFQFPFSGPFQMGIARTNRVILNNGDSPAPLIIEFLGYALNPTITNKTTGEFIKVNREIMEGEKLIIDTNPRTKSVTIVKENGDIEDANKSIDMGSTFIQLAVGENEIVHLSESLDQGSITNIKYNNLYSAI